METTYNNTELTQKIQTLEATINEQAEMINALRLLIRHYEERLHVTNRSQFGTSSEQVPNQLKIEGLFNDIFNEAEDQAEPSKPEPTYEEITYKRKKHTGKREEDLSGLPVERIDYELPESERICPECGEVMIDIGVTIRDEVEIIPATMVHKEHAVHAYGCRNCERNNDHTPVVRAASPAPLIAGSLATPSAVAHLAVQKYMNGVPLYRQEKGFTYDNINLSRQTMANWIVYCAQNYLAAIYSLLVSHLLKEKYLHADETTVQVLQERGREAQAKSYEWLYRTGAGAERQIVIYEYQETRGHKHPENFLKGFEGYLHCDGYKAYHTLPPNVIVVGCWAHARRYWEKVYMSVPKDKRKGSIAECGLAYTSLLFMLENEYEDLKPDERHKMRQSCSMLVSDSYYEWIGTINALPKSLLGDAVGYSISQRKYLENVYLDINLEISNNRAERSIKPFVQGRKVWLFSCTPNGAEASSIFYSIIETAKENKLHPFHYLEYLLERLPSAKNSELYELLPWSSSLPDVCRVPDNIKVMPSGKKKEYDKPLKTAVLNLRQKIFDCQSTNDSSG